MAVEVVGERAEHCAALGRELVEIDVRAAHGHAQTHARTGDDLCDSIGADAEVVADLGVRVASTSRSAAPAADARSGPRRSVARDPAARRAGAPLGVDLEIVVGSGRPLDLAVRDLVIVAQLLPEEFRAVACR